MNNSNYTKPTDSELEILQILWQYNTATVREVHEVLAKTKSAGYTTTLKLMQLMHEKKLVTRNEEKRTHIYTAALPQLIAQKHLLQKMIDTVYAGNSTQLVMQVLGNHTTSAAELQQIATLLQSLNK